MKFVKSFNMKYVLVSGGEKGLLNHCEDAVDCTIGVISGIGKGVIGMQIFYAVHEIVTHAITASSTGLLLKTIGLKICCLQ